MRPPGTQETLLTQWNLMEPSAICDRVEFYETQVPPGHFNSSRKQVAIVTVGPHGIQETFLTQWNLMELRLRSDIARPHRNHETLLTQWSLREPSENCAEWSLMETRRPLLHYGISWNQVSILNTSACGTQVPLGHCHGRWNPVSTVTQHSLKNPKDLCETIELDGTQAPV